MAGVTPTGYNTTGAVVTAVSNSGTFTVSYANTTTGSQTVAGTVSTPFQASITARSAGTRGLAIRGATTTATGFANPLSIHDSAGTSLLQVTSSGNLQANGLQTINSLFIASEENGGAKIRLTRATAAATNPGANIGALYLRDGTTAGTLKLVVRAGASGAETTILDNIPQ